jgi:CO/xanthine dehydrogenase Mo-binding subunit
MSNISVKIDKVDAVDKMNGNAKYISDYKIDGMLYARTLRSSHAHADILSIQYPSLPKGYYIVDHNDIPGENVINIIFDDMPIFAEDKINYYLEPIALFVGPDKGILDDLISKTVIEYRVLKPTFELNKNEISYHFDKGDASFINDSTLDIIEKTYQTGYQEQLYIEPQGMVGLYDSDEITLMGSIQCPYYVKNAIIRALDCKEENVRVKQTTVGGAFGGKEEFPSLIACQLAIATLKIKKPISLIYEREEDMEVTTKRHPSQIQMTAYLKGHEIVGIKSNVKIDAGAYIGLSGVVLSRALIASSGVYTIDNLVISGDVCITNTVPNGAFRGFGAPQMLFAIEMFMSHIANHLMVDSLSFKKKHLAKQYDKTSTSGMYRDINIMPEMLEEILEKSNYIEKRKQYSDPNSNKGIGISLVLHGCGFTGSGEAEHIKAKVKLEKKTDDKVHILIAAVDMGQGIKTTMRKLVANILDLPIENIVYNHPDTKFVPDSGPTVASRTMMIVGGLVAQAAKTLKEEWQKGKNQVVMKQYRQPKDILWDEATFTGDAYPAYSWGINIVEVEVDKVTYEVNVTEVFHIYDIGKAIDEQVIKGQMEGGIMQGIGLGMMEVMNHEAGKIQQKNVTDYIIPTTIDTPIMHTYIMDNPYPLGPYGAKGAGELPLVGGAPAVALAIEQAINKEVHQIPVTPEYIMELMTNE